MIHHLYVVLAQVGVEPTSTALPGGPQFQQIVNGAAWFAGLACLLAMLVGGAAMAISKHVNNSRYEQGSKTMVLTAGVGALVVGAAVGLVNFFIGLGNQVG